ncbi:hypothetical protein J8L70_05705 [Pseudoalteromonas sp. MMG010]|uniref:hypothetical protein n=1 Tax=Pseudoalteromonas sp. MMG010 TaxID=2822685 RepID=UPI001B39F6E3|nr:hypothetical protein [Pseudoalteromonas sp. MMG010]MBQ4832731.1 hypothetical protein [Pseudoalteromonas sp. MMG010]
MKKCTLALFVLLAGCATQDEPPYNISDKQFHEKLDEQGNKIFAYVVSVQAAERRSLASSKDTGERGRGKERKPSRNEIRREYEKEYFSESSVLKLQLEDQAVELLTAELQQNNYCANDYKIDEVLWRDLSVQLRGRCL